MVIVGLHGNPYMRVMLSSAVLLMHAETTLMSSLRFSSSSSTSSSSNSLSSASRTFPSDSPPTQFKRKETEFHRKTPPSPSPSPQPIEHSYRCKSGLKLVEINKTYPIFTRQVNTVVDLCAAPGGFSQVAVEAMQKRRQRESLMNSRGGRGGGGGGGGKRGRGNGSPEFKERGEDKEIMVIAVDTREIEPLPHVRTLKASVLDHRLILSEVENVFNLGNRGKNPSSIDISNEGSAVQGGGHAEDNREVRTTNKSVGGLQTQKRRVQVVLHDGVSVVAGQHAYSVTYAQNHMALSALQLALSLFAVNRPWMDRFTPQEGSTGSKASDDDLDDPRNMTFLTKTLVSPHMDRLLDACRVFFGRVHLVHAEATRTGSLERYIVAQGLKKRQASEWIAMQHSPTTHPSENSGDKNDMRHRGDRKHGNKQNNGNSDTNGLNIPRVGPHLFSLPPQAIDIPTGKQSVWICFGCQQRRFGASPCPVCTR